MLMPFIENPEDFLILLLTDVSELKQPFAPITKQVIKESLVRLNNKG